MAPGSRRRVTVVLRSLGLGGSERQAVMIANRLQRDYGWTVSVVSFEPGTRVEPLLDEAITVAVAAPGSRGPLPLRAAMLARFVARLRRLRPDVLLPFTDHPNRIVGAVWPVTGARGAVWNQRDEGREHTGRPLERLALRLVPSFVANSEVGRRFLSDRLAVEHARIRLIRNGVELPPPTRTRAAWRAALKVPPTTVVATMVANLSRYKDHLTLVRAWSLASEHARQPAVLVLAGRRDDAAAAVDEAVRAAGIAPFVRLLGEIEDVSGLLAASDVAVFSSHREGCPNGVLEAMAAGLPVVATDIVGTREALGVGYPLLAAPADPAALADGLGRLLTEPPLRQTLGAANRTRAATEFSPAAAVASWVELLAQLADGRRPTASR